MLAPMMRITVSEKQVIEIQNRGKGFNISVAFLEVGSAAVIIEMSPIPESICFYEIRLFFDQGQAIERRETQIVK